MQRSIIIIFLILTPLILSNCGMMDKLYQQIDGLGFTILFSEARMVGFEKSVACYYNTYNKFPEKDSVLNNYSNSLRFSENDTLVFSSIVKDSTAKANLAYSFRLLPWSGSLKSDSSNFFIDSIAVYQFEGKLEFIDSLVSQNLDSLIVEMVVSSICATVFIKDDSIHYNNIKYPDALIDQMKYSSKKISLSNSCLKSDK